MAKVKFTSALNRFFPGLESCEIQAETIKEMLNEVEIKYPGMKSYVLDDVGRLRQHVNIFIGEDLIEDEEKLSDAIPENAEIFIFQALSGG